MLRLEQSQDKAPPRMKVAPLGHINGASSLRLGLHEKLVKNFAKHRRKIIKSPFAALPWIDPAQFKNLYALKKFERIAVVGMGGASLGTKALASALDCDKISFLDNVDSDFVYEKLKNLNIKKTLFLLVSKSGETIEVLSLAAVLFGRAGKTSSSKLGLKENFLAVTDNPASSLGKIAKKHGISVFQSPKNVPGRFSVLSNVGLLPAALAGMPIDKILTGAARASFVQAYNLACIQYLHFKNKKNIAVFFPYAERLEHFADWYVQLMAESIGKSRKIGITPVKAIGVKDQHSQLQLFLDGPPDKFIIFVKPDSCEHSIKISNENCTLEKLFNAEYRGVKEALQAKRRPFVEITFSKLAPETVGELFFFFELQVAFLGSLLNVNTESQPAVDLSKKITKRLMADRDI